jgi:FkbM family methyltransferase
MARSDLRENLQYRARNRLRKRGFEVVRVSTQANLLALHLARLFDRLSINFVLDVGARIGDYGLWLRRNGFDGHIASFEPVSESWALLQARSRRDPRWSAHQIALGAETGSAEINVTGLTYFSSFLSPNEYSAIEFGASSAVRRTEQATVRRLDEVLGGIVADVADPRIYLKMDTQGWDLEVLKGAKGCLDHVVALQSEVSMHPIYEGMPHFNESIDRLQELGFGLSGLFPVNLDTNLEVVEFDCVAVKRAGDW